MEGEGLPEEGDPFGDFEGGSENSQDPFSMDDEPRDWFTSNGAHIPIEEGEEQSEAFKDFKKEKRLEKSPKRDKILKRTRKEVQLPKNEYSQVMHELNTNLPKELKNMKTFNRSIGNYTYKILNSGFNNYKIIGKTKIDDIFY